MMQMRVSAEDVRRETADDARADREYLRDLSVAERREMKRQLACGAGGHLPLAGTWRTLQPEADGRLHVRCTCGSDVSRSAFRAAA